MPLPESQIPPVTSRIETELPVWPTEKYRQNGTHLHYRRKLSSSIPIDDLARLPGNSDLSGLISRKLWIRKIDGGGTVIRTGSTILRRKSADFPENTSPHLAISPTENSLCRRCRVLAGPCNHHRVKFLQLRCASKRNCQFGQQRSAGKAAHIRTIGEHSPVPFRSRIWRNCRETRKC
jgi:hypothetical protein